MPKFIDKMNDVVENVKVRQVKKTFFFGDYSPYESILNLKTSSDKISCLNYLYQNKQIDQENVVKVVSNFKTDSLKLSTLKFVESEVNKLEIIKTFTSDTNKYKSFSKIAKTYPEDDAEYFYLEIIKTFKNDELLSKALHVINADFRKCEIIDKITSIELKKEAINTIKSEHYKTKAIMTLTNDDDKVSFLNELKVGNQIKVIKTFTSDAKKKKYSRHLNTSQIADISSSFKKKNIVNTEEFYKTDNLDYQVAIISNIQDNNTKIKLIKDIKDEGLKLMLLSNFPKYKKEVLSSFNDKSIYKENLIDKDITIGIELEVMHKNNINYFLIKNILQNWDIKRERSIEKCVEITSPKLNYTYNSLKEIMFITDYLNQNNFYTTELCGGHIHIGANYLETVEEIKMLYHLYLNCEKIFYLISNKKGTLPRKNARNFASPMSKNIQKCIECGVIKIDNDKDYDKLVNDLCDSQYKTKNFGMNILNINNKKNTVEFRIPNATIDFEDLNANVILFARLIQKAKNLCYVDSKSNTKKEIDKLSTDIDNDEKLNVLLNLLFQDESEKRVYRERYEENNKLYQCSKEASIIEDDFTQVNIIGKGR